MILQRLDYFVKNYEKLNYCKQYLEVSLNKFAYYCLSAFCPYHFAHPFYTFCILLLPQQVNITVSLSFK